MRGGDEVDDSCAVGSGGDGVVLGALSFGGGGEMIVWDVAEKDKARLEPQFRDDVAELLINNSYDWRVVYAYRSLAVQTKLYDTYRAGGPLAAPPGESAHNFGLAVDVQLWVSVVDGKGPTGRNKVMDWNVKSPGWQWLFGAVLNHPRLHSGISFGDFDHIERFQWRKYKNWNTGRNV
jgi:hypothetical protein